MRLRQYRESLLATELPLACPAMDEENGRELMTHLEQAQ